MCPAYYRKENFYLQSRVKTTPKLWYQEQVIGNNTIGKVVKTLVDKAKIEGFFTNHSLHRSGGTRLFRAGVDRKLVKEFTGHRFDAIDSYQITSHEQREQLCNIIQGSNSRKEEQKLVETEQNVSETCNKNEEEEAKLSKVDKSPIDMNTNNVVEIVSKLINASTKKGKTVIKL